MGFRKLRAKKYSGIYEYFKDSDRDKRTIAYYISYKDIDNKIKKVKCNANTKEDALKILNDKKAELENKFINYCSDININNIDSGIFKQLASVEDIQVRRIYQKPHIMKRYAKMIFNINDIDSIDIEQTVGFFRRMIFIPFEKTIPLNQQDKKLHEKILRNKAGVLNWIIEGIEEVLKNEEIFISKRCEDFLDNFIQDSNLTARFVKEYSIKHSDNETISFQNMYDRFLKFCKNEGEKSITKTIFNKEMKKLKFITKRANSGMVWLVTFN